MNAQLQGPALNTLPSLGQTGFKILSFQMSK